MTVRNAGQLLFGTWFPLTSRTQPGIVQSVVTTIMDTQTDKGATISTDWISQGACYLRNVSKFIMIVTLCLYTLVNPPAHTGDSYADSVVVGINLACVLLLLLITLMVTSC